MIDWPNIKSTLTSLIADLSGLGTTAVVWRDEAAGSAWVPDPVIRLRVSSIVAEGAEEERREADGGDDLTVVMCGQRRFTLSILCESFTQDIANPNFAANVCQRIAIRMGRSTSLARYAGIFAVEDYAMTKWTPYQNGQRQVSAFTLDVYMRTVDNDTDDSATAGQWINEVVIDGQTMNDAAGPIAPQPHIDAVGEA